MYLLSRALCMLPLFILTAFPQEAILALQSGEDWERKSSLLRERPEGRKRVQLWEGGQRDLPAVGLTGRPCGKRGRSESPQHRTGMDAWAGRCRADEQQTADSAAAPPLP